MSTPPDSNALSFSRLQVKIAATASSIIGLVVIIGWIFDLHILKSVFPGLVTMKANTALAFIVCGLSLWLSREELPPEAVPTRRSLIAVTGGLAVGLLALLTFCQDLFGVDIGIDQLLFRESGQTSGVPGRMSPATAVSFFLLGSCFLLLNIRSHSGLWIAQALALTTFLLALLALVSYAYDVRAPYRFARYSSMAVHTSVAFLVITLGILSARPDRALMAVVTSGEMGGVMLRRLLPFSVLVPIALGWLRLQA